MNNQDAVAMAEKIKEAVDDSRHARYRSNIYIGKMDGWEYIKAGINIHYNYPDVKDNCMYKDTYRPGRGIILNAHNVSKRYEKQEDAYCRHHGYNRETAKKEWAKRSFRAFCRENYPDILGNDAGYGECTDGIYRFPEWTYDNRADNAGDRIKLDYEARGWEWVRENRDIVREKGGWENWETTQSSPDKHRTYVGSLESTQKER